MIYSAKWPLLISLLFAILTTALGYKLIQQAIQPTKAPTISVIIAANDLPPLTKLEQKDLALIQVSQETAEKLSFFQKESELIGHITVNRIEGGIPFRKSDLLDEQQPNPFQLPYGYRAITVENSPASGVGGYLKAGQYVDIIWNFSDNSNKNTILAFQNIKVLAIGPPTDTTGAKEVNTITLMMKTTDAVKLSYMKNNGNISFTLRPSFMEPPIENPPLVTIKLLK